MSEKILKYNQFEFEALLWRYDGEAAWFFVSVPADLTTEIKKSFGGIKRGWGSIPVIVSIGEITWKTSIFPDNKTQTYLLPIKKSVRKSESINEGDTVSVMIEILE